MGWQQELFSANIRQDLNTLIVAPFIIQRLWHHHRQARITLTEELRVFNSRQTDWAVQARDLILEQMQIYLTRDMKFRFVLYENSKCEFIVATKFQTIKLEMENIKMHCYKQKNQLTCKVKVWYFYFFYFYKLNFINVDTRNFLEKVPTLSLKLAFSGRVVCTLYNRWSNNY